MIITIITACILVASIIALVCIDGWKHENLQITAIATTGISGIAMMIMLIIIMCEHTMPEQKVKALQAERDAIIYQMDHELYLGDTLGGFNAKIISSRYYHDNPWTSWFEGDYVYEVDPIPLGERGE